MITRTATAGPLQVDSYFALMAFVGTGLGIAGVLLWVYFPR
jgi:hypothetical protein